MPKAAQQVVAKKSQADGVPVDDSDIAAKLTMEQKEAKMADEQRPQRMTSRLPSAVIESFNGDESVACFGTAPECGFMLYKHLHAGLLKVSTVIM